MCLLKNNQYRIPTGMLWRLRFSTVGPKTFNSSIALMVVFFEKRQGPESPVVQSILPRMNTAAHSIHGTHALSRSSLKFWHEGLDVAPLFPTQPPTPPRLLGSGSPSAEDSITSVIHVGQDAPN